MLPDSPESNLGQFPQAGEPEPARLREYLVLGQPIATIALIVANAAMFLVAKALAARIAQSAGIPASAAYGRALLLLGAKDNGLVLAGGEYWRVIAAAFLHANFVHIAFNMFALWQLGRSIEPVYGTARFLLIYFVAVAVSTWTSVFLTPGISVGASGGVLGLFGAFFTFMVRYSRLIMPGARTRLWMVIGLNVAIIGALGLWIPQVDNAGHLGGFLGGAILTMFLRPRLSSGRNRITSVLATAGAFAVVLFGAICLAVACENGLWSPSASKPLTLAPLDLPGQRVEVQYPTSWTRRDTGNQIVFESDHGARMATWSVSLPMPAELSALVQGTEAQFAGIPGIEILDSRPARVLPANAWKFVMRTRVGDQTQRSWLFLIADGFWAHNVRFTAIEKLFDDYKPLFERLAWTIKMRSAHASGSAPNDVHEEEQRLREAIKRHPADAKSLFRLAVIHDRDGRHALAIRNYKSAIAADSRYADAYAALALLYATSPTHADPKAAVINARKAVELRPGEPRFHSTLAEAYYAAGQKTKAIAAVRKAIEMDPPNAVYKEQLQRLQTAGANTHE